MPPPPPPLSVVIRNVRPGETHRATVIILHGLGDSGSGWVQVADALQGMMPYVKFVMPDAPIRTLTGKSCRTRAWYDSDVNQSTPLQKRGNETQMMESVQLIEDLIMGEITPNVPPERVFLMGFSQGCVIALLFTVISTKFRLGGVIALSGYLPLEEKIGDLKASTNVSTPILICHGEQDDLVPYGLGRSSACFLKRLGFSVNFNRYPMVNHRLCQVELSDISGFLREKLGAAVPASEKDDNWRHAAEKPCEDDSSVDSAQRCGVKVDMANAAAS